MCGQISATNLFCIHLILIPTLKFVYMEKHSRCEIRLMLPKVTKFSSQNITIQNILLPFLVSYPTVHAAAVVSCGDGDCGLFRTNWHVYGSCHMSQNVFAIVGKVDVRISGGFVFWPLALDSPNGVHQGLWILAVIAVKPKPRYPQSLLF